jgi:hypothetical protein
MYNQPYDKKTGRFLPKTIGKLYDNKKMWLSSKDYLMIWHNGKSKMLHEYVWEKYHGMEKPKGMYIHHKDGDKTNFDISNLELVSESTHQKIHAGWIRDDNGVFIAKPCNCCKKILSLNNFYERKGYGTPSAKCKKCHNL